MKHFGRPCRTVAAVNRGVICAMVALAPARAYADGIAIVGGSPRAIGRAGAATVGDDGGGALLINPAAMARRDTTRGQLGVAVVDDSVQWQSDAESAPLSTGQAGSRLAPLGAVIGTLGHWILGAGVMTAAVAERSLPRPGDMRGPLGTAYDYRYAGIAGGYRRDTLAIGAARRLGDSLALGLSLGASEVNVTEHRRLWAGFGGRDVPIGRFEDDVDVALTATDQFCASAVVGALFAPEGAPIELGASVGWMGRVRLDGSVAAAGSPAPGPWIDLPYPPRASLAISQPLAVRAGGRYVGDRLVAEIDGDLWISPTSAESATWSVHGVRVVDSSTVTADLRRVPSRISQRTHFAVRSSMDVELVPGFLWAIAGYAFSNAGTSASRLSPSFGDLGGHTLGLGIETTAGGFTVTLGWSRTWSRATRATSVLQLDNPFYAGDGPVKPGTYDASLDQVGILFEAELNHLELPAR